MWRREKKGREHILIVGSLARRNGRQEWKQLINCTVDSPLMDPARVSQGEIDDATQGETLKGKLSMTHEHFLSARAP